MEYYTSFHSTIAPESLFEGFENCRSTILLSDWVVISRAGENSSHSKYSDGQLSPVFAVPDYSVFSGRFGSALADQFPKYAK